MDISSLQDALQEVGVISRAKLVAALKVIDETTSVGPEIHIAVQLRNIKNFLNRSDPPSRLVFRRCVTDAWSILSSMKAFKELGFQLGLYFASTSVDYVLDCILDPIYNILYGPRGKGTGSCPLISGSRGVGRTTLMHSVFCILFLLLDSRVIPIFIDFSKMTISPNTAIAACANVFPDHDVYDTLSMVDNNKAVVLFCDEIQTLYVREEDNEKMGIVQQLRMLGKLSEHLCVCSGSSLFTVRWALHPTAYGFRNYQSLNSSVFLENHLAPVSDQHEFTRLCEELSGEEHVSEDSVTALYILSGGVGRYFDGVIGSSTENLQLDSKQLAIPSLPDSGANDWLMALFNSMLSRIYMHIDNNTYNPWQHRTVHSYHEIRNLADVYGISDVDSLLRDCCDSSILKKDDLFIDVLRPAILVSLYAQRGPLVRSQMETYALLGTLTGWSSPGEASYANAGHINEEPLLRTVFEMNGWYKYQCKSLNTLTNSTSDLDVADFVDKFVTGCSNLYEVEGMLLIADPSVDNQYLMTVVQFQSISRTYAGCSIWC